MTIQLYQYPVSHDCEKVRFTLSYKGLEYRENNMLPGVRRGRGTSLGGSSAVPVISHEGQGIQGSAAIITYLDERYPVRCLTPRDPALREAALEWELWLDLEVGIALRCFCYYHLLGNRRDGLPMLAAGRGFHERVWLHLAWKRVINEIKGGMKINADTAADSLQVLRAGLERLEDHLRGREFLVGGGFSRADLTAAALFAPMFRPAGYGVDWPQRQPAVLTELAEEFSPRLLWAVETYRRFRHPSTGMYRMPS